MSKTFKRIKGFKRKPKKRTNIIEQQMNESFDSFILGGKENV